MRQVFPDIWQELYDQLPTMCSREIIAKETKFIEKGTLANLDVKGLGIPGGRLVGKKVCYPKHEVVPWLMQYCGETLPEEIEPC